MHVCIKHRTREEASKRAQGRMTKGVGEMGQGRKRSELVVKL